MTNAMQRYLRAAAYLYLHTVRHTTLPLSEFEENFDSLVQLLEMANDERFRSEREQENPL